MKMIKSTTISIVILILSLCLYGTNQSTDYKMYCFIKIIGEPNPYQTNNKFIYLNSKDSIIKYVVNDKVIFDCKYYKSSQFKTLYLLNDKRNKYVAFRYENNKLRLYLALYEGAREYYEICK